MTISLSLLRDTLSELRRHMAAIRTGGVRVFWRKTLAAAAMVLAIPVVLLVRMVRPFILIRFGQLPSAKLGPLAANTEVYLCERDAGLHGRRAVDLFCLMPEVCNEQLATMWKRTLCISPLVHWLDQVNRWIPGGESHKIPWRLDAGGGDRDVHGLTASTKPHLEFTPEEEARGCEQLQALGIPGGIPFVCFHARDAAYLDSVSPHRSPYGADWSYHDYRNSNIRDYLLAAERLVERGYFTIRMGAVVKTPLPPTLQGIIDYASTRRTEFLDIYLGARCRFFLGDTSGILCISEIFRRPIALVNHIPLEYVHSWGARDLLIPKTLWLREERRFLTFSEILASGIGRFFMTEQFAKAGIEVIDNTPEEIAELAMEMDERLNGTWQTTEEDETLQRRFWALFAGSPLHGVIRARIGAEFLRRNAVLLGSMEAVA